MLLFRLMVGIKEAAERAIAFAKAALGPERTAGVRLEEVESTIVDGDSAWLITLSMVIQDDVFGGLAVPLGNRNREYKTFTVRKRDGEVTSMKIRELAEA